MLVNKRVHLKNLQSLQSGNNGQSSQRSKSRSQHQQKSQRLQLWERTHFSMLNWGIADICSHAVYATATPDMPTQPPTGPASRDPRKHYTGGDSFGRCSSIPELVAALTRGKGQLRAGDITDAFQRTSALSSTGQIPDRNLQNLLETAALSQSQYLSPKDISLILQAMNSLGWASDKLLPHFSYLFQSYRVYKNKEYDRWLDSFSPRYFSLIMNFMAQLNWHATKLVTAFHHRIIAQSRVGDLAAYTAADLGCIINALKKQPPMETTQEVLQALAADATRRQRLQGLMEVGVNRAVQYVNDLVHLGVREQGLLSCFWAFFKRREVLDQCNIRALSNLVSALAETGTKDDEFVDAIVMQVRAQEGTFSALSPMATCSMVLSIARLMQLHVVRDLPHVLLMLLSQADKLHNIPSYFVCRMLDSLARAREATGHAFPQEAIDIVLSELLQGDRRGSFSSRDVTILMKLQPLLPEGGQQLQEVLVDTGNNALLEPGYMVMGDTIKALRVAIQDRRAGPSAQQTMDIVSSQVKAHFCDKQFVYDNASQFPSFIAQATGFFVQGGMGRDRELMEALTSPMQSRRVMKMFTARQVAQTMYNMFRLRFESEGVQNAVTIELSEGDRLDHMQEQELAMVMMAMAIQRYGNLRLFSRLMAKFTRDQMLRSAVQGVLGINMALIALEEAKSAYRFSVRTLFPFAERCVDETLLFADVANNTLFYLLHVMASYRITTARYLPQIYATIQRQDNIDSAIDGVSIWWLSKTWWSLRHVSEAPNQQILDRIADLSLLFISQRHPQLQATAYCEVLRTSSQLRYHHPDLHHEATARLNASGVHSLKEYGTIILLEALMYSPTPPNVHLLNQTTQHLQTLLTSKSTNFQLGQLLDILELFQRGDLQQPALLQAVLSRVAGASFEQLMDLKPHVLVKALELCAGIDQWCTQVQDMAAQAAAMLVNVLGTPEKVQYMMGFASSSQRTKVMRACEKFGLQQSEVYCQCFSF